MRLLRSFLAAAFLLMLHASPCIADSPTWDGATQGKFVLSMTRDLQGNLWVGMEDDGLWRWNTASSQWTHFTAKDGLGDDNVCALLCDPKGRVWAGSQKDGVSVFNGQAWKNYDRVTGPLGGRVFALASCPTDGDVWLATDCGLARYSQTTDAWSYYTRADGLPDDQASALAFDAQGTLYVGTQANGIAIAQRADNYHAWRSVLGPSYPPAHPSGDGLPSAMINALIVGHDGKIYAGTPCGLASSADGGKTWQYLRGTDWQEKATQAAKDPLTPTDAAQAGNNAAVMAEDYVTTLAEDSQGRLWVGHRQQGMEVLDPHGPSFPAAPVPRTSGYVNAVLFPPGQPALLGTYGKGLVPASWGGSSPADAAPTAPTPVAASAALPSPAKPPTAADLAARLQAVQALKPAAPDSAGGFVGDDWATEGDWVGHYGRQYAELYGVGDGPFVTDDGIHVNGHTGPHTADNYRDGYTYYGQDRWDDQRAPYVPRLGYRRAAEWNDGSFDGNKYPLTYEGPDLWLTITVPTGPHQIGLYFFNYDGQDGSNRWRDFTLELKRGTWTDPAPTAGGAAQTHTISDNDAEKAPDLARTRVRDFWGGVWKRFLVQGPGDYYIKIGRNYSFATKVQAVTVDRVTGPNPAQGAPSLPGMGGVRYDPPAYDPATLTPTAPGYATVKAAQTLWSALDGAAGLYGGASYVEPGRILAYRAARAADGPSLLLANWRWALHLWPPIERITFDATMAQAWKAQHPDTPAAKATH